MYKWSNLAAVSSIAKMMRIRPDPAQQGWNRWPKLASSVADPDPNSSDLKVIWASSIRIY
jgi:hypothetical protein